MAKPTPKLKFEDAMKRLDEIVEAMDSGKIGIEESIDRYEEAMRLAAQCRAILDECEQRIRKIQFDTNGQPLSQNFELKNSEDGAAEQDDTRADGP